MICSLQKSPTNEENGSTGEWESEFGGGGVLRAQR
jgi:hypothetical protein